MQSHVLWQNYKPDWFKLNAHMETLNNRVLHPMMYLFTKSGVSFQTTRAFAVILVALLSATYLDVASDCEQQSKSSRQFISFVWSLLEPHP